MYLATKTPPGTLYNGLVDSRSGSYEGRAELGARMICSHLFKTEVQASFSFVFWLPAGSLHGQCDPQDQYTST